ncbi:MAG TPA: hypothetical protein VFJ17_12985 [Mycobacteriales bacterium]|nr:hypothetical protein [Mycobacteriales bacterium]
MRRATLALALGTVIAGPAAGAFAATGSTEPTQTSTEAPPADAHATAVTLDDLLKIGDTGTHAGGDGSNANASAISLGGSTLIGGKTGGSQTTPGSSSGALIDTGKTQLGQLQVTPWSASASHDANGSASSADAALAHATLIDNKTLEVWLLHSHSDSSWTAGQSSSSSTSDGANVNAGDGALQLVVLHSESKSGSKGSSYLVSINGNEIGSSDQVNGACSLAVPDVLALTCLDATGGSGSNNGSSAADTATATLGGSSTPQGSLTSVDASGKTAGATVEGEKLRHQGNSGGNTSGPTVEASRTPNGGLPFTGFDAGLISAYGAALAGLGTAILRFGRRRRQIS